MKIYISGALKSFCSRNAEIDIQGNTLREILKSLVDEYPESAKVVFDGEGKLRTFIRVYADEDDKTDEKHWDDDLSSYSKVLLLPLIAGGAPAKCVISDERRKDQVLDDEEIDLLFDMDYLNQKSEEELKQKTDLMNKFLKEIQNPKHNLRKLVDVDDDIMDQNPDKDLNATIDDDDNKEDDDDDDDDFNDVDYNDTNYYGDDDDDDEDMNDTEMYDDYYKDYYDDDYYGDEYWKNGNYDFGNMSDEDYEKMYGGDNNDYNYNYNENQSYKEMFMENKFACIFIICLIIMVILIAIFGKDFEDTQTLEIDPNKNKQQ